MEMICLIEWSLSSGTNSVFKYWWIVPIFVFIFCTSVVVHTCGVVIFCILLKSYCMDLSSWTSKVVIVLLVVEQCEIFSVVRGQACSQYPLELWVVTVRARLQTLY